VAAVAAVLAGRRGGPRLPVPEGRLEGPNPRLEHGARVTPRCPGLGELRAQAGQLRLPRPQPRRQLRHLLLPPRIVRWNRPPPPRLRPAPRVIARAAEPGDEVPGLGSIPRLRKVEGSALQVLGEPLALGGLPAEVSLEPLDGGCEALGRRPLPPQRLLPLPQLLPHPGPDGTFRLCLSLVLLCYPVHHGGEAAVQPNLGLQLLVPGLQRLVGGGEVGGELPEGSPGGAALGAELLLPRPSRRQRRPQPLRLPLQPRDLLLVLLVGLLLHRLPLPAPQLQLLVLPLRIPTGALPQAVQPI